MDPIPNTQPMSETQPVTPAAKSSKKYILISLTALGIIAVAGIALMYASTNKEAEKSTTQQYVVPSATANPTGTEEQQVESVTISDPENDVKDIEKDANSL